GVAASPSRVAIYTMQDLLQLDNSARMNVPGTTGDNWTWRIKSEALNNPLKEKLLYYTQTYYRENKEMIAIRQSIKKEFQESNKAKKLFLEILLFLLNSLSLGRYN